VKSQILFVSLGLALTVVIFVGANGQAPVSPPTPRIESPAQVAVPPVLGGATLMYERKGRRDPFEPVQAVQPGMTSPTLAAAQLKGILRGRTPRVLVETPDGLGYLLSIGDMLGEGRLIEIGADSAVFSVPARSGSTTDRIVLRLPED
jgi:hypothetical protein